MLLIPKPLSSLKSGQYSLLGQIFLHRSSILRLCKSNDSDPQSPPPPEGDGRSLRASARIAQLQTQKVQLTDYQGDGEGDDGGTSSKSAQGNDGKGFTFSRTAEDKPRGEGGLKGPPSNLRSSVPKSSYRDKLLAPGCGGFLVQHSEEEDMMMGWKEYFHTMNEKEGQGELEESDEEDNMLSRRMEGKPGNLRFTAEEYSSWCMPWMNSLIIKVLGANFPTYVIRDRIKRMWRPKDTMKLIPISNGYYIISFSNKEDREYAFQEGPWMIEDHYLIVQRWRPNFNPWKADLQCIIAAWVRLPDIPFEFYNVESLRRIGNMIGKMVKMDHSTSIYDKDGFA
ncbi:hypothetical protein K1719_005113 [Acacia pycnantha]|nr:hypothetical protein K1719_005113 [Acacia pycnantha]